MFYFSPSRDLAVAQIPKAGLMSIREWLGPGFSVVPNEAARVASRRVAFIRHPIERLKSCYSFFYWLADYGQPHSCGAPVDSWEAFVDFALTHDDEHWRPQSLHVGDVPNVYRRFENIGQCYEEFRPGFMPQLNRSTRLPTTDYRKAEIEAFYADDLALWGNA